MDLDERALFDAIYGELRRLAARMMPSDDVVHPTSLVHEAWLKIRTFDKVVDETHFRRLAARAMRQVLVDRLRARGRARRGDGWRRVTLTGIGDAPPVDLVELHDALEALRAADEVAAELVELRFFTGLSMDEAAAALDLSTRTAERRWRSARALLAHLLGP